MRGVQWSPHSLSPEDWGAQCSPMRRQGATGEAAVRGGHVAGQGGVVKGRVGRK